MDGVRIGLALRALRRRRGWTQAQLAARAGCSRSLVSLVESGEGDRLTGRALARLGEAMGARIRVQILWHGEDLDRLLDRAHARLVEIVVQRLEVLAWQVLPEVTFRVGGERGSIDVLASHVSTQALLVVEVKSVVPDVQATMAGLDRKARLAPVVARDRAFRRRRSPGCLSCPRVPPRGGVCSSRQPRSQRRIPHEIWRSLVGSGLRAAPSPASCSSQMPTTITDGERDPAWATAPVHDPSPDWSQLPTKRTHD
jgi:transcriptional regulator with XRE-family HTH domain